MSDLQARTDSTVVFIEDDNNDSVHFMVAREQFPRLPVVGEIVDIDVRAGAATADYVQFRVKDVRSFWRGRCVQLTGAADNWRTRPALRIG